jgi:hypothetical protein
MFYNKAITNTQFNDKHLRARIQTVPEICCTFKFCQATENIQYNCGTMNQSMANSFRDLQKRAAY